MSVIDFFAIDLPCTDVELHATQARDGRERGEHCSVEGKLCVTSMREYVVALTLSHTAVYLLLLS